MIERVNPEQHLYPPESAGRLITVNVPAVSAEYTVADIERLLLKRAKDFKSINYVYLTDVNHRLVGVISLKEVFQQPKLTLAKDVMVTGLITVHPHTDQERVVHLALSLFIATASSVVTGLVIPYLFGRLKQDPANASGPIATIVQDILTVTTFFLIASWVL